LFDKILIHLAVFDKILVHLAVFDKIVDILVDRLDVRRNAVALAVTDVVVTEGQNVGFGQRLSDRVIIS
jgi:hypothetical protein